MNQPTIQTDLDAVQLRQAVLAARRRGCTRPQIARELDIREAAVGHVLGDLLRCGVVERRGTPTGPSLRRLSRWDRILAMAYQDYTPKQIADEMGLGNSTISRDLAALAALGLLTDPVTKPRLSPELNRRRQRVQQLRKTGRTLEQIADALKVSRSTVTRDVAALRAKRVFHRSQPYHAAAADERARVRLGVLRLRQEGKRTAEIAETLKVSLQKVGMESSLLIQLGWLAPDRRGRPPAAEKLRPGNARYETVVGMLREGATLKQIGSKLGLTRERVRQLRDRIEAMYGPLAPELLSSSEAARYLGLGLMKFLTLVDKGLIERHGPPSRSLYRLGDLQSLRRRRDRDSPPPPLVGGPYRRPRCRVGKVLTCQYRDREIAVAGLTDGPIRWPYAHRVGRGGSPSLIICGDLVRAIGTESLLALCHYWGVSNPTVRNWRRALGIGRATAGMRHLYELGSVRANGKIVRTSYRPWTPEEDALLGTAPNAVIAQRLGRSRHSVSCRRRRLALPTSGDT